MGFEIDAQCNDCKSVIESGDSIYCSNCAKRQSAQCCTCKNSFPRFEMFTKAPGVMCHHCAFLYEQEFFSKPKAS